MVVRQNVESCLYSLFVVFSQLQTEPTCNNAIATLQFFKLMGGSLLIEIALHVLSPRFPKRPNFDQEVDFDITRTYMYVYISIGEITKYSGRLQSFFPDTREDFWS